MQLQLSDLSGDELEQRLSRKWPLHISEQESFSSTYYDTFDWRLYLAGLTLAGEGGVKPSRLELRQLQDNELLMAASSRSTPGMLESIKDEPLRQRLAPVIEMRRLLPQVRLEGRRKEIRLVDDEEKTLVILELLSCQAATSRADPVELPLLLRVKGLKGYGDEKERLLDWLDENGIGHGERAGYFDELLSAVDAGAGEYSSKLNFRLDPEQRADTAAKHILSYLLGVVEANVAGCKADIDSEFLHDLRVAVRRTRSALSQIKEVFEPQIVEHFKTEFAWVGQITGPTRDMDVYLLKFPAYVDSLPAEYREALTPFHRYLQKHQRSEQRKLAKQLADGRFDKILAQWRAFLDEPVPTVANPANAVRPALEVAGKRIYKMYRRVMKEGKAIDDDSHPEELHELRKSCKKLRYLMEFFQSLYPGAEIKGLIKSIKILLDNLGDFQDLEVQAAKLRVMSEDLRKAKASTETLLAIGMLIDGLLQRQHQERSRFAKRFAEFSGSGNRALFVQLFKNGGEVA